MSKSKDIPLFEYNQMTSDHKNRYFPFTNMIGIAVPAGTGFAIAYDSSNGHYMGVIITPNGEEGYVKRNQETILMRTCETFFGRKTVRGDKDIVAKLE